MRLVLLGPPGSGKGTQAEMIATKLGIPRVSTGDILRDAVSRNTALGAKARSYMDQGRLVPDEIMIGIIEERLNQPDCANGYILDGFPRTLGQAIALDEMLAKKMAPIDLAILIDVSDETVVRRLTQRRICPRCHAVYNLQTEPPKRDEICDKCGTELVLRSDDQESTVRTRLRVYRGDTLAVIQYYDSKGVLKKVDGQGNKDTVFNSIVNELEGVGQK
ncbi:MAG: adenylate kinase [bacterium]